MYGWHRSAPREGGSPENRGLDGRIVHLVLYKFDRCPYCVRVFRALDSLEVSVAYRDTRTSREHLDELRSLTGSSQVPCLVINGQPLLESADIVAWLRDNFPSKRP